MSDAPAPAIAATPPDPNRAVPAALPRVACLLRLVRLLVNYGTGVLAALQPGGAPLHRAAAIFRFGTKDLALIVARIACGLRRAAALEARLNRYVVRGKDIPEPKPRPLAAGPRARKSAPVAEAPTDEPARLAALPSAEEIAEQVRTRSLGVVITDICHDLGLASGVMEAQLWDALMEAVRECGIDLVRFIHGAGEAPIVEDDEEPEAARAAWPAAAFQAALALVAQPP
jgi:hypothetical protein